ncbi:unnamed protein product [Ectocarpus sp. CCAP 1310/34]|nr:unnamed protein product [Ectocarpus sp. CCAP 1310/34]
MAFHCGKWFYRKQDEMLASVPAEDDVAIYIKVMVDRFYFTWFETFDEFWEWYFRAQEECNRNQRAFSVYEILRTGRDMCFIADLEVYCPPETHWTQLQKIEYTIKNLFREAYGKYADAENLVITQNSRMSEHKEKGGEKEPMYKISLHFLGRSEIFNEIHTSCEMKALAEHVKTALVADMQPLVAKHDIVLPDGNVLDLGIYTRNRPMSLIGTAKKLGGGAFERTEESKHVPIRSCIVTQQFTRDVSYFELPDGLEVTKKKTKRNIPTRRLVHRPRTRETSETELLLLNYLCTKFGDSVTVTHNGVYGGQDSYAVRGHRAFCPCCEDSHDSNGAFLTHLGELFFRYKCMNPHAPRTVELDLREFHCVQEPEGPEEQEKPRYLPSFTHVKSKVISICAPMRSGKTFQIERDIDHKDPPRVLVITCRRGMAATLTGRFSGFTNYQDGINKDRQIIEYESLHRLSWIKYDMIIMDELRSTLNSALIYQADRVICADADLYVDGAVQCFYDTVFKNEEIHHIDHKGGGQELHVRFTDSAAFVKMILKDLRAGKRIGVCCGSALELKTIEKLALDIVHKEKLGIYYANSPQQAEIADVSAHWPKYKLIGLTSTITVSVDYTGPIDRVYISPSQRGCGPRDMNQMKSRFRNITSGIVVVKVPNPMRAPLEPLIADMAELHTEEMNRIMNRRTYITGVMTENQRELNRTIFKQGVGHEARFYPSLLTELLAWSHVERFLADFHWIQYLFQIFEAKGYTWSNSIDRVGSEEEGEKLEKYFGAKGAEVKEEETDRLNKADAYEMDGEDYERLVRKQRAGAATLEDVAKIKKYKVQCFYRDKIDANDVEDFNKFRGVIHTRAFFAALPPIVRKRIDMNLQLMRESLDEFRLNYTLAKDILDTLKKMGFKNMGIAGERLDLRNMPDETKAMLDKTITSIRTAKLVRTSRAAESREEFKCYIKSVWGYKLKSHQVKRKGKKCRVYSLVDLVPERLLRNEMYSANWLEGHCKAVNKFVGHGHDERKLIKPQLPMMEMDLEPLRAAAVASAASGRKRKRSGD